MVNGNDDHCMHLCKGPNRLYVKLLLKLSMFYNPLKAAFICLFILLLGNERSNLFKANKKIIFAEDF